MIYIKNYIKENISILIVLICFLFISVFNAFMNIGIIEDGCHHFWEALIAKNIWLGHEGIETFPFNSRYFPSLIQHLSVGIPMLLGIVNLKILLFIFTIISYFLPVMILIVVYFNIPKYKRNCFEIVLLYFLTCMNFLIYQIWTENFLTGLFLWVIFVIYYYVDFDELSVFNLISLIAFSIFLSSSHPMAAVFVIPMIIFATIKQYKTKNISLAANICLILSYILLFFSFCFNLYFIFKPIYPKDDYLSFTFLKEPAFMYFYLLTILILIISLINIKKLKNILLFIVVLACFGILNFVLLEIKSFDGYMYRILGFYVPLFLMLFILLKDLLKLSINYNYIKIINTLLILIFVFHSIYYGISWNRFLVDVNNNMINNERISFIRMSKYGVFHFHTLPYDYVFIPTLFNTTHHCKIVLSGESFLYGHVKKIKKYEDKLSKLNLNVNIFITE